MPAYSEFFVTAQKDAEFKEVLEKADLIIPDGVGPLAAVNYTESLDTDDSIFLKFIKGLKTGVKILKHEVGETVPGVWLFQSLIDLASKNSWKIFLLGGFDQTVFDLEQQLKIKYPNLKISVDPGQQKLEDFNDNESIEKINKFKPDLLFVAYGQIKQEKWISTNKNKLKAKIAVGVGSTFDEVTGKIPATPQIMEQLGLKWLWRLICEPKRFRRILNAYPVFPWLVFQNSI